MEIPPSPEGSQSDLTPAFKTLERKNVGRVMRDSQGNIVAHMIGPKIEPGLPPPAYDIALTGIHGEVQILDLSSLLARERTKFDQLTKEGSPFQLKNGVDLNSIISELTEAYGLLTKGNSTETGNEQVAASAIQERDKLIQESIGRRKTLENVENLRQKSATSLKSILDTAWPESNDAATTIGQTITALQPNPAA